MTGTDEAGLTEREKAVLQALMDKRDVYAKNGHVFAAKIAGELLRLVWQVFKHLPHRGTSR